jgi:hypothetical protein
MGDKLFVAFGYGSSGPIYLKDDASEYSTQITNSTAVGWSSALASSADGSRLALVVGAYAGGPIFTSDDSGVRWEQTDAPVTNWISVASSADGSRLAVTVGDILWNSGGIYTRQTMPRPKLNIAASGSGLLLSWIVPSMPFVLQENANLNTTDWIDVPTQPTLNLSNLNHEVSVPLSNTNRFYRLKCL